MAKKKNDGKAVTITTPSPHGSHRSMIVKENEDGTVVCKDERGEYITYKARLDNGMADPRRFSR